MASVTGKKFRRFGLLEPDEAPEHDNKETEQIIQDLVKKQTNTRTSLAEQLSQHKEFASSTEVVDLSKFPHGECSLQQFSQLTSTVELTNQLRSRGLSDSEVKLALELRLHGEAHVRDKYRLSESSALDERLRHVRTTLDAEDSSSTKHSVSRHEQELIESVRVHSESSRLLQFAQSSQQKPADSAYPADHPINQLRDIEQRLFGHLAVQRCRKRRRGTPKIAPDVPTAATSPGTLPPPLLSAPSLNVVLAADGSQWDRREVPRYSVPAAVVEKSYGCSAQTWYTVQNNKTKFLGCKPAAEPEAPPPSTSLHGKAFVSPECSHLVPLDQILAQRLSTQQIKQMTKFSSYHPGEPSKTLFCKNLAAGVRELDLVSVFANFEARDVSQPRLVYRLMTGKMRGQAFVTFSDTEHAVRALEAVNGFQLKGRPIILQYGRSN